VPPTGRSLYALGGLAELLGDGIAFGSLWIQARPIAGRLAETPTELHLRQTVIICSAVLELLQRSWESREKPSPQEPAPREGSRRSKIWISPPQIIPEPTGPKRGQIRQLMSGVHCDFVD
jgi:hypothetical protein